MPEVRPVNPEEGQALPPEVARSVSALARALVAAARSNALYPPEHPAVKTSVDRLRTALREASAGQVFSFVPSDRITSIMTQKDSSAFNTRLLRRFINLMGLFPVGTLVRLSTDEVAVVTHEHPSDPFRPQVKLILDRLGEPLEEQPLVNTWEPDARGDFPHAVVEAVDPDSVQLDPLSYL